MPPAAYTWIYEAKDPDEVFQDEPHIQTLIKHFGITQGDLSDVPLCPLASGPEDKLVTEIGNNVRTAYLKILGECVEDYVNNANEVKIMIVEDILYNRWYENKIIENTSKGTYDSFTETVIDGTLVLDADGNPVMIRDPKASSWDENAKQVPEKVRTYTDDCTVYHMEYLCRTVLPKIYWVGETTSAKPPVVLKIRPRTRKDYETFFSSVGLELPEYFNLIDEITTFREKHGLYRKGNFECCDALANINLCMKKTVYKKFL